MWFNGSPLKEAHMADTPETNIPDTSKSVCLKPNISKSSFEKAVKIVGTYGDTDIFPFPIDVSIMHDLPAQVVRVLQEAERELSQALTPKEKNTKDSDTEDTEDTKEFKDTDAYFEAHPINSYSTLSPVSQTGFRWATQIDPFWVTFLLAAVIELAPEIEQSRLPIKDEHVFSYRYDENSPDHLYVESAWKQFQEATRRKSSEKSCKYVVTADISDFYPRIYHHRLENSLRSAAFDKYKTIKLIMKILSRISNNNSYGLPVGCDASRLLAECALDKVDHLLVSNKESRNFCRYVDDYRFFVKSKDEAYRVIAYLSEKLQMNEGLSLQKSKTRIMSVSEYQLLLDPETPRPGSSAEFMSMHIHYDPYSSTADTDYEQIKENLSKFSIADLLNNELKKSQIHVSVTKKLLGILKLLQDDEKSEIITTLLDNIEKLTPVIPQVMIAIKKSFNGMSKENVSYIQSRIRELISSDSPVAQIDLNKAYMVRVLGAQYSRDNELLLVDIYRSAQAPVIIKRDIMLIMANWKVTWWLSDRKNYIAQEEKWVQRAFFIASYSLGDEGKHWRMHNKWNEGYDNVIKNWAGNRQSYANRSIPV